jgi:thiol-disulfide isomerase/thioredoxin
MKYQIMKTPSLALFVFLLSVLFMGCNGNAQTKAKSVTTIEKKHKVTFYELGSVRCIPCKQMQPILKSIEEKYKDQVDTRRKRSCKKIHVWSHSNSNFFR